MKVIVCGAAGQVGRAIVKSAPPSVSVTGLSRSALDVCDARAIAEVVGAESPDVIVNCAAYTNVDQAEHEPELAFQCNAGGPEALARTASDTVKPCSLNGFSIR